MRDDGGTAWVAARWAALATRLRAVDGPLAGWARDALTADPVGAALAARHGWDALPLGDQRQGYDQARSGRSREALGQVFTPRPLADLLAAVTPVATGDGRVLDPACGDGSLLLAVARARRAAGASVAQVLAALEGWDRDVDAAWSARAALVEWALDEGASGDLPALAIHGGVDALGADGRPGEVRGAGVFAVVVSNPPYLEAKRMGRAEPGLRARLREAFPQLGGAFDLYLAFCWRALEWLAPGGGAGLLLPNKVLQGRYAAGFRAALVRAESDAHLEALIDLARLRPRPFPGTSVYPAILHVVRRPVETVRMLRVAEPAELDVPEASWARVPRAELARLGGEDPLFVPFATWPALVPLFALPRLGDVARAVTACSFHHRGLRERYVTPERGSEPAFPYLGGPSRARQTEVAPFRTRWAGWWIHYDADALRAEWKNALPDLARTFLRPKAIFCQHATRMQVYADFEGRFVSKDVYPVAWPAHPDYTLGRLVAVLQSTVFTALYNTVYQGIVVGGETYHYLPAHLQWIPVPDGAHPALSDADARVRALQATDVPDPAAWDALDRRVAEAYGVSEVDRQAMITVHLRRVGAEAPGG